MHMILHNVCECVFNVLIWIFVFVCVCVCVCVCVWGGGGGYFQYTYLDVAFLGCLWFLQGMCVVFGYQERGRK